jgi:hypothetical protein
MVSGSMWLALTNAITLRSRICSMPAIRLAVIGAMVGGQDTSPCKTFQTQRALLPR